MKYVITGSLGHISKALTEKLLQANHEVSVISNNASREAEIEKLGAKSAIGSLEDAAFLTKAFAGADAVYLMIPPNWTLEGGWYEYQQKVANNFAEAIKASQVKNAVLLSSVGAHLRKGAGPIDGLGYAEEKLGELKNVNLTILRPSYFYYNLFAMVPMVKNMNMMGSNFGSGDEKIILTHTNDIAQAAADVFLNNRFGGHVVQYLASDERSTRDIAAVLGASVNKPETPWVEFTDDQAMQGMVQAGLKPVFAEGYVQLGKGFRDGTLQGDYWKNKPAQLGKIKLEDFAKEFAGAYNA